MWSRRGQRRSRPVQAFRVWKDRLVDEFHAGKGCWLPILRSISERRPRLMRGMRQQRLTIGRRRKRDYEADIIHAAPASAWVLEHNKLERVGNTAAIAFLPGLSTRGWR